jgi:hypothetical protein
MNNPMQYTHQNLDSQGRYQDGRHGTLIYSQPPGQFKYTPTSPETGSQQQAAEKKNTMLSHRKVYTNTQMIIKYKASKTKVVPTRMPFNILHSNGPNNPRDKN